MSSFPVVIAFDIFESFAPYVPDISKITMICHFGLVDSEERFGDGAKGLNYETIRSYAIIPPATTVSPS